MATLYAIFSDDAALEAAVSRLKLGDRVEVISSQDYHDRGDPATPEDSAPAAVIPPLGAGGGLTIGGSGQAMVPASATLAGALTGPERRLDALPEGSRRIFGEALRGGAQVLVVRHADGLLEDQLRALGAQQVARG